MLRSTITQQTGQLRRSGMNKEVRKEIMLHALRWANNILIEVLSAHARSVNNDAANLISQAASKLEEAQHLLRRL